MPTLVFWYSRMVVIKSQYELPRFLFTSLLEQKTTNKGHFHGLVCFLESLSSLGWPQTYDRFVSGVLMLELCGPLASLRFLVSVSVF